MAHLSASVTQLWPEEARKQMESLGISPHTVRKLFERVLFPWDTGYDGHRVVYQSQIAEFPLFVVVLSNKKEALFLLDYVAEKRLSLRTLVGRHSSIVQNPQVYADLSALSSVALPSEEEEGWLTVAGGTTQGQVYDALFSSSLTEQKQQPHVEPSANCVSCCLGKLFHGLCATALHPLASQLGFPGGSAGSVGVVGLLSCGGIGSLRRTFGLGVDHVTEFEIALPPGAVASLRVGDEDNRSKKAQIVRASPDSHLNLFWALRGGVAANFGIVLSVKMQPITVPSFLVVYSVSFSHLHSINGDHEDDDNDNYLAHIIEQWQRESIHRPDGFNEDLALYHVPNPYPAPVTDAEGDGANGDGDHQDAEEPRSAKASLGIAMGGIYVPSCGETPKRAIETVRQTLHHWTQWSGASVTVKRVTYAEAMRGLAADRVFTPFSTARLVLGRKALEPSDVRNVLKKFTAIAKEQPGAIHLLGIELLGGQITKAGAPRDTAYYPRKARFLYDCFAYWSSVADSCANSSWASSVFQDLYHPLRGDYVYVGFPIQALPHHRHAYWGGNVQRLLKVKRAVDPHSILTFASGLATTRAQ